ncbi:MAG: arylesterase [Cryomorphaceae bacterium]|nr:arylesterase [Flavobacteriales bacterium]
MDIDFNKIRLFSASLILSCILLACGENENREKTSVTSQSAKSETDEKNRSEKGVVLFFGNSLTAGYGVEADESFPALIQKRIDSLGLPYTIVNAGISGETTATGLNRIDWVLDQQNISIFVLELGANDGLRGLPPEQTKDNLKAIISTVREKQPSAEIILAGMMVPPSMGQEYGKKYNRIFPEIAKEAEVDLIPFLLDNVGGIDSLNQDDGIHPNPAGNKIVVENVWSVLSGKLNK